MTLTTEPHPNALVAYLDNARGTFLIRCVSSLLYLGGYALMCTVSWKLALGFFMIETGKGLFDTTRGQ